MPNTPSLLAELISPATYAVAAVCLALATLLDVRRRRLSLEGGSGWGAGTLWDVAAFSLLGGFAGAFFAAAAPEIARQQAVPLRSLAVWGLAACLFGGWFLWDEGRRQVQLQRPRGLVFAEFLVLGGLFLLASSIVIHAAIWQWVLALAAVLGGTALIAKVVRGFVKGREEHRVLRRIEEQGDFVQAEWMRPTPECPHPERWRMLDPQSAELEVLDFLEALVCTAKPALIVETGTFVGRSAISMARALASNGFGKLITIEFDPLVFAKAKQKIEHSGVAGWIEMRNASSLETSIAGAIDLLYSDSDLQVREQEVRHFLPQISPRGLILIHDASSHFEVVREAALRLEAEGLLSVILLSTPRGMCLAQKREGRT